MRRIGYRSETVVFVVAVLAAGFFLSGCAGSRPAAEPLLDDYQRLDREAQELNPGSTAAGVLQAARAKRDQAQPLIQKGKDAQAYPLLESAVADARLAVALAQADEAEHEGDQCLQAVESGRRGWDEVQQQLIQTEQVARKTSDQDLSQLPDSAEVSMPHLPASTLDDAGPPAGSMIDVASEWKEWTDAAAANRVGFADLEERFEPQMAAAGAAKGDERPRRLYLAGRTVQELESRVRREVALSLCARSAIALRNVGEARSSAWRGILELEREMKDELRQQLEQTRAAAADRTARLFEALQQFQGPSIRVARDARGVVVSLLTDEFFPLGKDVLKSEGGTALLRIATVLNQFPDMRIAVEGHTDNVGRPEYNLEHSKRRAEAVYKSLVAQGVPEARMSFEGYGMNRPATGNTTDEERKLNRRVDLVIQKQR